MYISEVQLGMNTTISTVKDPECKPAKKHVDVQLETYAESEANHSKKQDDVCFEKLDKKELDRKGLLEQDKKGPMKDKDYQTLVEDKTPEQLVEDKRSLNLVD